jgi:ergothioneine biosynthesis protein EgtB
MTIAPALETVTVPVDLSRAELLRAFQEAQRDFSNLTKHIHPDMLMVQLRNVPEASPGKWHLMHACAWFWEAFVLTRFTEGYKEYEVYDETMFFMANSYYRVLGQELWPRNERSFGRPTVDEIRAYSGEVIERMEYFIELVPEKIWMQAAPVIAVGIEHMWQHNELFKTDMLVAINQSEFQPLPGIMQTLARYCVPDLGDLRFNSKTVVEFPAGKAMIGLDGPGFPSYANGSFGWPNESPRREVPLEAFALSSRLVDNRHYMKFMSDGGYNREEFWSPEGFRLAQSLKTKAPMHWVSHGDKWLVRSFRGTEPVLPGQPVSNISNYEAAAFAEWFGFTYKSLELTRLPTEFEFEHGASHPEMQNVFGAVWQHTSSTFYRYKGFEPFPHPLSEYDGLFVDDPDLNVMKGSSVATRRGRKSLTERNYWSRSNRTQLAGIRLAGDRY